MPSCGIESSCYQPSIIEGAGRGTPPPPAQHARLVGETATKEGHWLSHARCSRQWALDVSAGIFCMRNGRSTVLTSTVTRIPIRTPRVWDEDVVIPQFADDIFQPALPVWGATESTYEEDSTIIFQSAPPAWGATSYIHNRKSPSLIFQPALPVWGATEQLYDSDLPF